LILKNKNGVSMSVSRVDIFKQMLEADPQNTTVRYGLANEYLKAERYMEAVEELKFYLENADDQGAAYGMLARAYEKIGKMDEARKAYEKGIEVSLAHGHPSMAEEFRMTLAEMD
jgi:predicted Zn-dependent protease